jgi:hypothetical protein
MPNTRQKAQVKDDLRIFCNQYTLISFQKVDIDNDEIMEVNSDAETDDEDCDDDDENEDEV